MKIQLDIATVNKLVTDKRMNRLIEIAEQTLKIPVKGLTFDTNLQPGDADIIGMMLLAQIKDETGTKFIFTDATKTALQDAAKTWFLGYLKENGK